MSSRASVSIEAMTPEDIPQVLEVDRLSFPIPWSSSTYRYELTQNPNSYFFVARSGPEAPPADGVRPPGRDWLNPSHWFRPPDPPAVLPERQVVGYGGFWYILDEAHISTIAVHPDWRSQGIGEHLFVAMLEKALDLQAVTATLEVRVSNERAQSLYRKYAFEVVGRRKRYYRDNGEDALLMTAQLHPGYREHLRQHFTTRPKGAGAET